MLPKGLQDKPSERIAEGQWQGKPIRYFKDRMIVKFNPIPEMSAATLENLSNRVLAAIPQAALVRQSEKRGRAVFAVAPSTDVLRVAQELSQRDDIEYAEPDVVDAEALIPNDPSYITQWGLEKIHAPNAWNTETGSSTGVLIGIIDSGISLSATGSLDHSDLDDSSRYLLGTDYVDGGTPRDLRGHGTHVAGIAAAETDNAQGVAGMNWRTPVYVCRTLDAYGSGGSADFADAVEEIVDYALAHGMKAVINYSAGGGANNTKRDACQYVNDSGMILCAATGNDYAGAVIFPAAYSTMFDGVIAVGATDENDQVADFSNVGPEVTVVAPGKNILSTMPTYAVTLPGVNYGQLDGTSMATPFVTGLVSLIWSQHPGWSNTQIRERLTSTAKKLGSGSFSNAWGYGRIDAANALGYIRLVIPPFLWIFAWAWMIVVGGLLITPGGVFCIVCGLPIDIPGYIGLPAVTLLGIGSIVLGIVGLAASISEAVRQKSR